MDDNYCYSLQGRQAGVHWSPSLPLKERTLTMSAHALALHELQLLARPRTELTVDRRVVVLIVIVRVPMRIILGARRFQRRYFTAAHDLQVRTLDREVFRCENVAGDRTSFTIDSHSTTKQRAGVKKEKEKSASKRGKKRRSNFVDNVHGRRRSYAE